MKPSVHKALVAGILTSVILAVPGTAAAQAVAQTVQVLPPGGTGCAVLPVHAIVAHVSDGALHSFDVTVGNPSYVAVLAQVGSDSLPFRYMTRFQHGGGTLRHHVDLDPKTVRGSVPVSLTLLSSPQGSPTCLTIISFSVSPTGAILAPGVVSGGTSGSTAGSGSAGAPSSPTGGKGTVTPTKPPKQAATTTAPTQASNTPTTGISGTLGSLCAGNGAFQLWFLLLAIYVVIAALTALAKPPLAQKSLALPLALVLVPLVLLLGFWYFTPTCRAAGWVPAVSIIVAIAALLVALREQNPGIKVIPLPAARPSGNTPAVVSKPADSKAEVKKTK